MKPAEATEWLKFSIYGIGITAAVYTVYRIVNEFTSPGGMGAGILGGLAGWWAGKNLGGGFAPGGAAEPAAEATPEANAASEMDAAGTDAAAGAEGAEAAEAGIDLGEGAGLSEEALGVLDIL